MAKTRTNDDDKDVITFKVMVSKDKNPKAYEWAKSLSWGMFPKFVNDILTLYAEKGYLLPNDWILENDTKSVELLQRSQNQQVNADGMQDLLKQLQGMQEQMMFMQKQLQMQQHGLPPMGYPYIPPNGYIHPYAGQAHPQHQDIQQHYTQGQNGHIQSSPIQEQHIQAHTSSIQTHTGHNAVESPIEPSKGNPEQKHDDFVFTLPPVENDSPMENSSLGGFGGEFQDLSPSESENKSDDSDPPSFSGFQMY
jgi:hypothetical protein